MKRSPMKPSTTAIKRVTAHPRAKAMPVRRSKPRRTLAVRDGDWLSVVHLVPCVRCGNPNSQAAHRNIGKGMGMKTDDAATAALCMSCHYAVDNGNVYTREERRAMMDGWIVDTLIALVRMGKVGVIE